MTSIKEEIRLRCIEQKIKIELKFLLENKERLEDLIKMYKKGNTNSFELELKTVNEQIQLLSYFIKEHR